MEKGKSDERLPSFHSSTGCCQRFISFTASGVLNQKLHDCAEWRVKEQQIRLSGDIKGDIAPTDCIVDSIRKPTQKPLVKPHPQTPTNGPQAPLKPYVHHSHFPCSTACSMCIFPEAVVRVRVSFGKWLQSMHRKKVRVCGSRKAINLGCTTTFWKTKEKLSAVVWCHVRLKEDIQA